MTYEHTIAELKSINALIIALKKQLPQDHKRTVSKALKICSRIIDARIGLLDGSQSDMPDYDFMAKMCKHTEALSLELAMTGNMACGDFLQALSTAMWETIEMSAYDLSFGEKITEMERCLAMGCYR